MSNETHRVAVAIGAARRLVSRVTVEIDGAAEPACVAELVALLVP